MRLLVLIMVFVSFNTFAVVCSQEDIEKNAREAADFHKNYMHAKKIILGRGTYENKTGYFPLFLFEADCHELGRNKCHMSAILFANLESCNVGPGPTNTNLKE